MMKIYKEENQYFAQYFEEATCSATNNTPFVNNVRKKDGTIFLFKENDLKELHRCAYNMAKFINGKHAEYIGRKTVTERADIIFDHTSYSELKLTKGDSKSTYFGTSIFYIPERFKLKSLKDFMIEDGIYNLLEAYFDSHVYDNHSPVDQKVSSVFRHQEPGKFKILTCLDKKCRKRYTEYLANFFWQNPEALHQFILDMLTKNTSHLKGAPDIIYIYHYDTDKIETITKEEIAEMVNNSKTFKIGGDFSFVFDRFRITFSWQNGTALNNPTIRLYLK